MKPRLLVPDTGILVALGLGEELDSKSKLSSQSVMDARTAGVRVVVPPSVLIELERKLADIDEVYTVIQSALASHEAFNQFPAALEAAERFVLDLRSRVKGPAARVVDLVESQLAQMLAVSPGMSLPTALAAVVGNVLVTREVIRLRSRPTSIEFVDEPKCDPSPLTEAIPEVTGMDLAHLRACEWLGEKEDCTVILLVFERPLHRRRDEIRRRFPKVLVTTPLYLPAHLEEHVEV